MKGYRVGHLDELDAILAEDKATPETVKLLQRKDDGVLHVWLYDKADMPTGIHARLRDGLPLVFPDSLDLREIAAAHGFPVKRAAYQGGG